MVELWDILDENGDATGRFHERGKPMNENEYHLEVCVLIENDKCEYLISQRTPNMYSPKLRWDGSRTKSSGFSPHDFTIN